MRPDRAETRAAIRPAAPSGPVGPRSRRRFADGASLLKHCLVYAMVCGMVWGGGRARADDAAGIVDDLHHSLIAIMQQGDALGYQGRYQTIAPVIDATHDLEAIARIVVGRQWRTFTETQRADFVRTFRDLSIATYAGRFTRHGGEEFSILSDTPLSGGRRRLVSGQLVKSDGERLAFRYVLHQVGSRWKIINISVNGVSDLALKRAEYGGILQRDGLPTLLEHLRTHIQDHADGR